MMDFPRYVLSSPDINEKTLWILSKEKDGMVILEAPEWSPIRQVNFVASLDKMAADQTKKRYPEIEVPNERPFKCLSFARKSFVYFLDLDRVLYLHADRSRSYLFILSKASLSMNSPLRGEICLLYTSDAADD